MLLFFTGPQCACVIWSRSTERMRESVCVPERGRVCARLFSSLNTRVIVRGPSWPEAQPFAIFIVGKAATVKSN